MANQVFVSPDGENWKVKVIGNKRASAICGTKTKAVERAKEIAQNQHPELLVQKLDGTISWRNSYGNDPRKSKGWRAGKERNRNSFFFCAFLKIDPCFLF